ncbi:MAG: hypothetical protein K6T86_10915 [Pirellulales bacterium]|nr:hypothetical protein [Pirellulales bacterium]
MPRPHMPQTESIGSDSFTDVVTNIVGILIILVLVVGIRAERAAVPVAAAPDVTQEELAALRQEHDGLQRDDHRLSEEIELARQLAAAARAARDTLQLELAQRQAQLEEGLSRLDAAEKEQFELRRQLSIAEGKLARAQADLRQLEDRQRQQTVRVVNYPTPLSQTVFGKEIHFQLRRGRVAYVPMDELVAAFKAHALKHAHRLQTEPEFTETLGPLEGFRMRYTMERIALPADVQMALGHAGMVGRLREFILLPISAELGEPLAEARAPQSAFRNRLAGLVPRKTTVTLWTYPDSFAAFRTLREDLYLAGFTVAGRPLPEGQPIGGSPDGSKSAAQ